MKKQHSWVWSLLMAVLALAGCGQATDTVTVTLKTGLANPDAKMNFMENISQAFFTPGPSCLQKFLFGGYKLASDTTKGDAGIFTLPLSYTTPVLTQNITYSWLSTPGNFYATLQVLVPRGVPVDFGMKGVLYDTYQNAANETDNGACLPYHVSSGNAIINNSVTLTGHTNAPQVFTQNASVDLNVTVLDNPNSEPAPIGGSCLDTDNDLTCPKRNFFTVVCSGCQSSDFLIVTGLNGQLQQFVPLLSSFTTSTPFYILREEPATFEVRATNTYTTPAAVQTITFPSGTKTATANFVNHGVFTVNEN